MNLKKLIQDNWKGAVVGVAVMAAAAYGGPLAGKAAGFILPKALEHVSNTPVEDVLAHRNPIHRESVVPKPAVVELKISARERAMLRDVAKDFKIGGRLSCTVVQR